MTRYLLALTLLAATVTTQAQETATPTQALISLDSKTPATLAAKDVTAKVDNRLTPLTNLSIIPPNGAQVALLIDDGLRTSVGRELNALRSFITTLPAGTEVFVGYMQNGRVVPGTDLTGFTADRAAAAQSLHLPTGIPGSSASPYFCLSDFVKNWPSIAEGQISPQTQQPTRKARFVLMITNGVDPYNGSTSILNQNSPYVDAAVTDAQRSGVPVYSIFFSDAGFGRGRGTFSGQSYLSQLAQGTGGVAYYQGQGNPVSLDPYLKQFQQAIAETYVATFPVDANKKMVSLRLGTDLPKTKLRGPDQVRPGTIVAN
ncbi:vWA domain-containing protein [Tunturiibacter lichenicola]|uniref:hypothetical protein n=1 Tax=Tunturiibacter lichenicola TaxID=2051959 RepID=UPI0021B2645A|nr:hypothetical protein [Edaphobacter lichenicola]